MTPHEEIEYIVNAAYLRGCDSNFKTAIAAMQESEKKRLNSEMIKIHDDGGITTRDSGNPFIFWWPASVYGAFNANEAAQKIQKELSDDECSRLAELVKLIKSRREAASA